MPDIPAAIALLLALSVQRAAMNSALPTAVTSVHVQRVELLCLCLYRDQATLDLRSGLLCFSPLASKLGSSFWGVSFLYVSHLQSWPKDLANLLSKFRPAPSAQSSNCLDIYLQHEKNS